MDAIAEARDLYLEGRFSEADERLRNVPQVRFDQATTLLKARILEGLGNDQAAEALASQVLRSRHLNDANRWIAEFTLARVAAASGDSEREVQLLQRALATAERTGNSNELGWTRLRLLAVTADRSGADSCRLLMGSLRRDVSCAGEPNLSAALHLAVADLDGKRGLLSKSKRHVHLAQSILSRYPNVWLRGWSECTLSALCIVQSNIPSALVHAQNALALGAESGSKIVTRTALGNLGRLNYLAGDFESALDYLNRALETTSCDSGFGDAILESIARVYMAQGKLERSSELLIRVAIHDRNSIRSGGYVHRHSLLTKAEILSRIGDLSQAREFFDEASALAQRAGDHILCDSCRLLAGEAVDIESVQRQSDSEDLADECPEPPMQSIPEIAVLYERALAARLVRTGNLDAAVRHRDRAIRICRAVSNRPAEIEVSRSWSALRPNIHQASSDKRSTADEILQDISSLLMHAGRPELVSTALMSILERAHCLVSARAVSIAADGNEEVLAAFGTITDKAGVRRFTIGTARDRTIELQLEPLADVESQATVNSIAFTIATVQELERGRIEREERLTLWPVDELPAEDDDSVVAGKMREVMLYTRKIAQTSVTVLITGESGTGKEVLARAIHRYSIRVKKPFVPFNCTAVPRELIESHLFGYKRGAFTGADRDNPGLIRAAKDGTLFLDEIGELGLDLQPKLLRFLESGEINPLGETSPFGVNVRIVAATNANLQKLVAEGRFREDLYYRLNVIPIVLPPLRERREEIAPLAQYFALKWSHQLGKGCIRVADDLMEHLVLYHWPGNIRQLSNEINRMVATADPDTPLTLEYLSRPLRDETEQLKRRASGLEMAVPLTDTLQSAVDALEREMIKVALRLNQGKVEAAAKALGISRKGLYLKRQRLGL